jgi:hypothetical protein
VGRLEGENGGRHPTIETAVAGAIHPFAAAFAAGQSVVERGGTWWMGRMAATRSEKAAVTSSSKPEPQKIVRAKGLGGDSLIFARTITH